MRFAKKFVPLYQNFIFIYIKKFNIMAFFNLIERVSGKVIDQFATMDDAVAAVQYYENIDVEVGCYEPNFYDVVKNF